MNSDQMSGKWKQMKGAAQQQWGKLTNDDLEVIAGKHEALAGRLQERYGMAKEDAEKKAHEWLKSYGETVDEVAVGKSHEPAHMTAKR